MATVNDQSKTCLVIGGRSFVGKCLVVRLLQLGNWIVRVAGSTQSVELDVSDRYYDLPLNRALSTGRASYFHVDVCNRKSIVNGSDAYFNFDFKFVV